MEKYELNGEIYYFTGKNWVDSHYTVVKREELSKLNNLRSADMFIENKSFDELLIEADQVKNTDDYLMAIKIYEKMLEIAKDSVEIRKILPRYTSMLRKDDRPFKAIEMYQEYYARFGRSIMSPALYTSVAAACCDVNDVENARKSANLAYKMSEGNASPELISVFARIKKLEK